MQFLPITTFGWMTTPRPSCRISKPAQHLTDAGISAPRIERGRSRPPGARPITAVATGPIARDGPHSRVERPPQKGESSESVATCPRTSTADADRQPTPAISRWLSDAPPEFVVVESSRRIRAACVSDRGPGIPQLRRASPVTAIPTDCSRPTPAAPSAAIRPRARPP
jgi:hypothetical protein